MDYSRKFSYDNTTTSPTNRIDFLQGEFNFFIDDFRFEWCRVLKNEIPEIRKVAHKNWIIITINVERESGLTMNKSADPKKLEIKRTLK